MRRLAILRPEPGATATAQAARSLGLDPIVMPLFKVEATRWTAPDPGSLDGLLITSANAIRCGGGELDKLRRLPVFAVGEATAAAAEEAGFTIKAAGQGGVDALLASIPPTLRLLHLCGDRWREPRDASQTITRLPVYRSAELPLPANFRGLEGAVVAVHSPRAAERLAELTSEAGLARDRTIVAAISAEAAASAGGGWQLVEAAPEPNDRALLALAARLCHNAPQ
jgi:uroporphyrinogen-III synthase